MFCMECGTKNADTSKFCKKCGHPLSAPDTAPNGAASAAPASAPTAPTPTPDVPAVPLPTMPAAANASATSGAPLGSEGNIADSEEGAAGSGENSASTAGPASASPAAPTSAAPAAATAAATKTLPKKTMMIIAAVVAVILVICGGAFATYRAGIWGAKVVPNVEEFQPPAGQKLTANIVAKQLNDSGIRTEVKKVYSGKSKGEFAGLDGVKSGDRVQSGQTVTVNESMGPGVPEGTVGKQATAVVNTLKDMGATVKYRQIVVNDTSRYKAGEVVATSPDDGDALTDDYDNTINVGVATKGDGVGYDLLGMDKDKAKSALESKGYSVTLKPHFSSKQYIGKISYAEPAFGTPLESGDSVTLYYGVDSSQVRTLFTTTMSGQKVMANPGDFLTGRYCKADSSDCFTLGLETQGSSGFEYLYNLADDSDTDRMLTASRSYQSFGVAPGTEDDGLLINGDTGAFELFTLASAMGGLYCGDEPMGDSIGVSCVNGQKVMNSTATTQSGLTQRMDSFYTYFPVGSDVKSVESSGYFDADALAKAKKEKAVDTSRPFIVMRDKSLYSKSQTEISRTQWAENPFLPANPQASQKTESVKMKPAPSNASAYYLVEAGGASVDWESLNDADIAQTSSKSSTSSDSDSKSTTSGADAASAKIFAELAGSQYAFAATGDGSAYATMTLKSDGTFSGTTDEADLSSGTSVAEAPRKQTRFSGRFSSAKAGDNGTYTLQCDASAFKIDDSAKAIQAGFDPCATFAAYPAGTSAGTFSSGAQTVLRNRGEWESGPKDWLIVNMGVADESIPGTYERIEK
ncbi:PASTA domain-containing protein [Bifidobacterium sp. SMB2]|uniref:PASTA domain-containing protein n=1 Tax=Bifidobacterium saimiriisciurei TaxID=2661627 RepID=A0ABX0C917_9BIFI|nr:MULTISPECIES: PASTA domain-containing protein [Bifidobacterium]NEG95474.1 PASTA domain-containing protein [Bifidobacterium sp. SMB2]NEH11632.1 PASTA domain-containing protein [Bifidobacterium saimiriisciurei]